jgi:O-6-methylguanine DNA methyltransferase
MATVDTCVAIKIRTPDGCFTARFSERGLAVLDFPDSTIPPADKGDPENGFSGRYRRWYGMTAKALFQALAGRKPSQLPPLDLEKGTPFQQAVWRALMEIPSGETRSYREIAQVVGRPQAFRAVGQACGTNPIPVFVPCHRVLAARGRLGGFSGGLDWKKLLLDREGVSVR